MSKGKALRIIRKIKSLKFSSIEDDIIKGRDSNFLNHARFNLKTRTVQVSKELNRYILKEILDTAKRLNFTIKSETFYSWH